MNKNQGKQIIIDCDRTVNTSEVLINALQSAMDNYANFEDYRYKDTKPTIKIPQPLLPTDYRKIIGPNANYFTPQGHRINKKWQVVYDKGEAERNSNKKEKLDENSSNRIKNKNQT